jgi:hypothetical protein
MFCIIISDAGEKIHLQPGHLYTGAVSSIYSSIIPIGVKAKMLRGSLHLGQRIFGPSRSGWRCLFFAVKIALTELLLPGFRNIIHFGVIISCFIEI